MPGVRVDIEVTEADQCFARRKGMSGTEVIEYVINRAFDNQGVPREGRMVDVNKETQRISIELPAGWWMVDPETNEPVSDEAN